jgi:hypothetical protein
MTGQSSDSRPVGHPAPDDVALLELARAADVLRRSGERQAFEKRARDAGARERFDPKRPA